MALQYAKPYSRIFSAHAVVTLSKAAGDGFALLRLEAPQIAHAARPGQFVSLVRDSSRSGLRVFDDEQAWAAAYRAAPSRAPGSPPLLRRPISIHRADGSMLDILFKIIGRGTRGLATLQPGESLDLLGPMGNGFDLSGDFDTAIIAGGGIGLAPLPFLAEGLHRLGKRLIVVAGAKSEFPMAMEPFRDLGARLELALETPTPGYFHGVCTPLLQKVLAELDPAQVKVFSCGPWPMLKAVHEICAAQGFRHEVSLEQRMGCALGACMACVRRVIDDGAPHNVRVCTEGPVFDGEKVAWNE